MTKSRNILPPKSFWTTEEIAQLKAEYPDTPTAQLAAAMGRTERQLYCKAKNLGIGKSEAYLASPDACRLRRGDNVGAAFRFQKGHVPANKGINGWSAPGSEATRFKPGRPASESRNYLPIGSVRITKDGYLERKITDDPSLYPARRWVAVHRLVWEAANGPVPSGHLVVFRPGQHTTIEHLITIDRLECISRRENMARNTVHNLPKELAQLVQLQGAVNRVINRRSKT